MIAMHSSYVYSMFKSLLHMHEHDRMEGHSCLGKIIVPVRVGFSYLI